MGVHFLRVLLFSLIRRQVTVRLPGVPSQSGQPIYTGQPIPPVGGAPTPSYGGPAPAGAPMGGSQPFGQMPGPIGFEEATPIDDSFGDLPIDGGF